MRMMLIPSLMVRRIVEKLKAVINRKAVDTVTKC